MVEWGVSSAFADARMTHGIPPVRRWVLTIAGYNWHGCSVPVTVWNQWPLLPSRASPRHAGRTSGGAGRSCDFQKALIG